MVRGASFFCLTLLLACGGPPLNKVGAPICGGSKGGPASPLRRPAPPFQCGPELELTPVNQYAGEFAPVIDREDAVVLINGACTGTWIEAAAGNVVVTAGHCVALGDRSVVVFNHEDAPDGDPLITEGTAIEQSLDPDYALIQLDATPVVTPMQLTSLRDDRLAIIQHPRGLPKVVAEGWLAASCDDLVYYSDLDTLVGSSGAGVMTRTGYLLGVHADGNCDEEGFGTNHGATSASIVDASEHLVAEDIADR